MRVVEEVGKRRTWVEVGEECEKRGERVVFRGYLQSKYSSLRKGAGQTLLYQPFARWTIDWSPVQAHKNEPHTIDLVWAPLQSRCKGFDPEPLLSRHKGSRPAHQLPVRKLHTQVFHPRAARNYLRNHIASPVGAKIDQKGSKQCDAFQTCEGHNPNI